MDKESVKKLHGLLKNNPVLAQRFLKLRQEVMPIIPSQYDVTNICNLSCIGCLYFEGEHAWKGKPEKNFEVLNAFFQQEAKRGVNFPHFGGAEPSLHIDALKSAAKHFKRGVVYSNGIKPISTDIPFRIHISVWADSSQENALRGRSVFEKALKNYRADPRVVFVMTLSSLSLSSMETVAKLCHEYEVRLTFNHYSPPERRDIQGRHLSQKQKITGLKTDMLCLTPQQLVDINETVSNLKARYPKTIIFSEEYGRWIARDSSLYQINSNSGWAEDCASRLSDVMHHYHPDLSREISTKCCTPNIECESCRLYSMAYASKIDSLPECTNSESKFTEWLNIAETWRTLFI